MRPGEHLFNKLEWRPRHIRFAARSKAKVVGLLGVNVVPDAMSRGEQWTGAGAVNAPDAMEPPHEVQDPEDRDRAADDQKDDKLPAHSRVPAKDVLRCYIA